MKSSTKDKIKSVAASLFAIRGYEGTSMNDIASRVGITKASLYAHFTGKDEIFLAVYQDTASDYESLNRKLFEEAKEKVSDEQLFHIFQGYILYYHKKTELAALWTQMILFPPPHLREQVLADIAARDQHFHIGMTELFQKLVDEGIVRRDSAARFVMSFRAIRDGLLSWMHTVPQMKEEWIRSFWSDLWLGLQVRKDAEK